MDSRLFWITIGAGILSSVLFTWLLDPFTKWVWLVSVDSTNAWLTAIQDAAYSNAALGKREWVSALLFIYFATAMVAFPVGLLGAHVVERLLIGQFPRFEHAARTLRRTYRILEVVVAVLILLTSFNLVRHCFDIYVDLQLNASFSQRLDVLAPHITSQQEKELRASWALMKSRRDYAAINRTIETLASAAAVPLPPPLYQ